MDTRDLYLTYIKGRTLCLGHAKFCENIRLDIIALSVIIGLLALENVENVILFFGILFTGVLCSQMILKSKFFPVMFIFFSNLKFLAFFGILFLYGNLCVGFGPLAGFILFREILKLWRKSDQSETKKIKLSIWRRKQEFRRKIEKVTKSDEILKKVVLIMRCYNYGILAVFVLKIILAQNYGEIFIFGNFTLAKICFENLKFRNIVFCITRLILPQNFQKSKHKNGKLSRNQHFVKIAELDINFQKDFQIEKARGKSRNSRCKWFFFVNSKFYISKF